MEQEQALSCWLAQAGAQQGPIISMSPLDFGQQLLGISYHSMVCVYHSLHHLSSRDRLHLQCPNASSMPGLPAQLVLHRSGQQGPQRPCPQNNPLQRGLATALGTLKC